MIKKQDLVELREELGSKMSKHNSIVKIVIDELTNVDFDRVDVQKSEIRTSKTCFELYLYSMIDNPFTYIYIENSTVEVQIGQGAQFLELTNLKDENDIFKFEQVIRDLFYSSFYEKLIYKGNSVVSARYSIYLDDYSKDYNFSIHFPLGLSNMFKKRKIIEHELKAWID